MPFVQHALAQLAPGGVLIFLLRLALLETQGRRLFWAAHPPARVAVCVPRPSFTADGHTDATAYAIYQWIRGTAGPPRLEWLRWSASPAAPATSEPARSPPWRSKTRDRAAWAQAAHDDTTQGE